MASGCWEGTNSFVRMESAGHSPSSELLDKVRLASASRPAKSFQDRLGVPVHIYDMQTSVDLSPV